MLHSDLMQFKDEMLKNLREMERKIMTKVNKNQSDFSSDLSLLTASLNSLKENNKSLIDSITEQKLNMDKITTIESDLKKFNSALSGQEKKINESMVEISYIRERYEKSLSDTLSVPGIIGKNCKYSNFNDYIISNNKEIAKLKSEKEYSKKESKELKQKLEQGIKSLSNLVDSCINRSKLYTDGTKKAIIELIDTKFTEIETKNLDLLAKLCKIDTEFSELSQKMKIFGDDLNEFNTNKAEQIQKVEDKLLIVNNHIEEIDKSIKETKEEIISFKNNEEKYMHQIYDIKHNFNTIVNTDNSNNENNEINNNTSSIDASKDINNLMNKVINMKEIKNNNSNIIYNLTQTKPNYTIKNSEANHKDIYNFIESNKISTDNNINDNNPINNDSSQTMIKPKLNNDNPINQKESLLSLNHNRSIDSSINTEKTLIKFNNNNINNAISTFSNLHKNIKFPNLESVNNNKKITKENIQEEDNLKRNIEKNIELINKPSNTNKQKFFIFEKSASSKPDELSNFLNKKIIKEKFINTGDNAKQKKKKLPILNEKLINNIFFPKSEVFLKRKNNIFNKAKNISPNKNKTANVRVKNKNNLKYSIDKETGVGCKIVKLSIEDDSITPYNTNGLLTMASNKFLKKKLIKSDESLSFSFDNIFSNIYQYQINRNSIDNKKRPKCNKTVHAFFGEDKNIYESVINSNDNNIKKEFSKTIKI